MKKKAKWIDNKISYVEFSQGIWENMPYNKFKIFYSNDKKKPYQTKTDFFQIPHETTGIPYLNKKEKNEKKIVETIAEYYHLPTEKIIMK